MIKESTLKITKYIKPENVRQLSAATSWKKQAQIKHTGNECMDVYRVKLEITIKLSAMQTV